MTTDQTVSGLRDLLPEQWFSGDPPHKVRLRAYQMARLVRATFPEKSPWFATARFMTLLGFGKLSYVATPEVEYLFTSADEMSFRFSKEGLQRSTVESPYAVVVAPAGPTEDDTRLRLDIGAGLLAATLGRNAVFHLLFENLINLTTNQVSVSTPIKWNPLASEVPELSPARLDILARAFHAIADLEERDRNRVRLALHWHEQALRSPAPD